MLANDLLLDWDSVCCQSQRYKNTSLRPPSPRVQSTPRSTQSKSNYNMFAAFSLTCLAALLFPAVVAGPTSRDVASDDWKFARGWDGVVSSPSSMGTPLDGTASTLKSRAADAIGGIFICDEANWGGTCGFAVQPLSTCIPLGTDWNNKISSLGPDPGTLVVVYDAANCTGTNTAFVNPGTGDLAGIGWDDRISSFQAFAT